MQGVIEENRFYFYFYFYFYVRYKHLNYDLTLSHAGFFWEFSAKVPALQKTSENGPFTF